MEYLAAGSYVNAVLGEVVCVTCLGVIAWALNDRA